jgi:hypothetical protein
MMSFMTYASPNVTGVPKSRRMRNVYRIFVGRPEGTRTVGGPRRKREDNIRMNLREIGWGGVN